MSVTITGAYHGNKKILLTHEPSGATLTTAAPKDNQGDGSSFSPTDLVAAALGACTLTVMSISAERDGVDLTGVRMEVTKHMATDSPRRIARLPLTIHMPRVLSEEMRSKYERIARTCPVHHSLHPSIEVQLSFMYDV